MSAIAPCVSIGLPVYNGEQFLAEVLDSLLAQTFVDFELIIADNASTDRTPEICRDYANKDSRIQFHQNPKNLGAARNYNLVFELSKGKYFRWTAADDLCKPDYLQRCVEVLDRENDVVLCYPKTTIIGENGQPLQKYEDGLNLVADSPSARFIQTLYSCRLCNAVFGLIRSDILAKTRLIKDFISCDKALLMELSLWGKFREIPEYLFERRFHIVATGAINSDNRNYEASFVSLGEAGQLEWLNPALKNKSAFVNWTLFRAYLASVWRTPIKWSQKSFTTIFLFATLFVNRSYVREIGKEMKHTWQKVRNFAAGQPNT